MKLLWWLVYVRMRKLGRVLTTKDAALLHLSTGLGGSVVPATRTSPQVLRQIVMSCSTFKILQLL